MKHRRNAVLWAIGWWIVRRQIRRRAAVAFSDVGASAAAQRGRLRAVLGAVLLIGLLVAGLVAVRKLLGGGGGGGDEPELPVVTAAATGSIPGVEPA